MKKMVNRMGKNSVRTLSACILVGAIMCSMFSSTVFAKSASGAVGSYKTYANTGMTANGASATTQCSASTAMCTAVVTYYFYYTDPNGKAVRTSSTQSAAGAGIAAAVAYGSGQDIRSISAIGKHSVSYVGQTWSVTLSN